MNVKPLAAGGGGNALVMDAYVASAGSPLLDGPRRFSNATVRGDPSYILWLPLVHLMPGSSLLARLWFAVRFHLLGAVSSAAAFGRVSPRRAVYWAWQRAISPWGAIPIDLSEVKERILEAY